MKTAATLFYQIGRKRQVIMCCAMYSAVEAPPPPLERESMSINEAAFIW